MRGLVTLSGALSGLLMLLIGSMTSVAFIAPSFETPINYVSIGSNLQVPALLLCALVAGPKSGIISAVAYITIGLLYIPVFEGGGGFNYISNPSFGYLIGFIPAAWISGRLSQQQRMNNLVKQTLCAFCGLILLHITGIINLLIGVFLGIWPQLILDAIYHFTIVPLSAQITICPAIGLISLLIKNLLLSE